jgi:PKD repeat protein
MRRIDITGIHSCLLGLLGAALLIAAGTVTALAAEDPGIEWQKCLGGSDSTMDVEEAYAVQQTADGGFIVAGRTGSSDGDVEGAHGGVDAWAVKLDPAGDIDWQRCLGGTDSDSASAVQQTADGGYILAGTTRSTDGDVVGCHGPDVWGSFRTDAWVVKLGPGGALDWQRCLGGSDDEAASGVRQTAEGGYVVVGSARSMDGDVGGVHSGSYICTDVWVVKLDDAGTPVWNQVLGGFDDDMGTAVDQTSDGGYVVGGITWSGPFSGDVSGNHGQADAWVLRLNAAGGQIWSRCLGGTGVDRASAVRQSADGGYVIAGTTGSVDGDVTGTHGGGSDAWVLQLNATGGLAWQRCLGGTRSDSAAAVEQTSDGGYIMAGKTGSTDGDVSGLHASPYGFGDAWIVKLDARVSVATVPGGTAEPTDTNADGICDDVNGNGRADFADVVLYFDRMGWIAANEPVPAFDCNGNGRIDFADVVWLFNRL